MTASLTKRDGDAVIDSMDGVCASCGASSTTQSYTYDALNQATSRTLASGIVTLYDYDGYGNLIQQTDGYGTPEQRTTTYEFA